MPGGMELAVILLIAVLLFGANKIPKLARSTGQAMGEFKRGREEIEEELNEVRDAASVDADLESSSSSDEDADLVDTSDVGADEKN
ncbi:MAG: twin-arginine translocase TatA/TatE family subunit [Halobacteriales archaeon]|nr:twin-arginine translocase TatA/TatE family subunit [Halobacteriales archaeon]